jgi:hypothetical protein
MLPKKDERANYRIKMMRYNSTDVHQRRFQISRSINTHAHTLIIQVNNTYTALGSATQS